MTNQLPVGRERRRTDLYGRTRRFLYGLLLLAAAPGAHAADEMAAVGRYHAQPAAAVAPVKAALATIQGLIVLAADRTESPDTPIQGNAYPRIALDTVTARTAEPGDAPLFRVSISEDRSIKDGVGFDLQLPDFGNFHLNLYARKNARTEGVRYDLGDEFAGSGPKPTWSLGGTLELVRTVDGGKHIAFVPELVVDLSGHENRYLPFQASLKFANWRSLAEKRALEEEVAQLAFKWQL